MKSISLLPLFLIFSCCAPLPNGAEPPATSRGNHAAVAELGKKIWRNECAGTREGLVSWNAGENFPSMGIGHFIWYPKSVHAPFEESFLQFTAFAARNGIDVPSFFKGCAPWSSRRQFLDSAHSPQTEAMRNWLASHTDIQAAFLVWRSRLSAPRIIVASAHPRETERRIKALSATPQGCYALIDYVNFKGEGIKPEERYKGQGWGLLQVLEEMNGFPEGDAACREFSRAAAEVMKRRVRNSPPARGESRWLAGWLNRCRTYSK